VPAKKKAAKKSSQSEPEPISVEPVVPIKQGLESASPDESSIPPVVNIVGTPASGSNVVTVSATASSVPLVTRDVEAGLLVEGLMRGTLVGERLRASGIIADAQEIPTLQGVEYTAMPNARAIFGQAAVSRDREPTLTDPLHLGAAPDAAPKVPGMPDAPSPRRSDATPTFRSPSGADPRLGADDVDTTTTPAPTTTDTTTTPAPTTTTPAPTTTTPAPSTTPPAPTGNNVPDSGGGVAQGSGQNMTPDPMQSNPRKADPHPVKTAVGKLWADVTDAAGTTDQDDPNKNSTPNAGIGVRGIPNPEAGGVPTTDAARQLLAFANLVDRRRDPMATSPSDPGRDGAGTSASTLTPEERQLRAQELSDGRLNPYINPQPEGDGPTSEGVGVPEFDNTLVDPVNMAGGGILGGSSLPGVGRPTEPQGPTGDDDDGP
jgi:hypothetical protein